MLSTLLDKTLKMMEAHSGQGIRVSRNVISTWFTR